MARPAGRVIALVAASVMVLAANGGALLAQSTGQEAREDIERVLRNFDRIAGEEPFILDALRANLALKRWIDEQNATLKSDTDAHDRAVADMTTFCTGTYAEPEFSRRQAICAAKTAELDRQGEELTARRAELTAKDAARLKDANAIRASYDFLRQRAKTAEEALAGFPAFAPVSRLCAPQTGIQAKNLCLQARWADTGEHDRRFPEPPSPSDQPKNRALIGGMTWVFGEYAMNVPQNLTGEQARLARAESERQFFGRLELAGVPKDRFIAPEHYNFILGVAYHTNVVIDLPRAYADNLARGRATPGMQKEYDVLRGRTFDALDCHSNGAMLCLAGLANDDIKLIEPKIVRLMGPQITPEALLEWQRLSTERKIDLQIYINDGDPVPRISYMAKYLLPNNSGSPAERLALIPNVLKEAVFGTGLKDQIEKEVPSAHVYSFGCGSGAFRYSVGECHDLRAYQNFIH
jgi:hypothetical protein